MFDTAVFVVQKIYLMGAISFFLSPWILDSSPIDAQVDTSEQFP